MRETCNGLSFWRTSLIASVVILPLLSPAVASANQKINAECVNDPSYSCLLGAATKAANSNEKPIWRYMALSGIADVQIEVGDIEGAEKTLSQVRRHYNTYGSRLKIIRHHADQNDFERALSLTQALGRQIQASEHADEDIHFGNAVEYLARKSRDAEDQQKLEDNLNRILNLAHQIKYRAARADAYLEIATSVKQAGQDDVARLLYQEALRDANIADQELDRIYLPPKIAIAQHDAGFADDALVTLQAGAVVVEGLRSKDHRQSGYVRISLAYRTIGNQQGADAFLARIDEPVYRVLAMAREALLLVKSGDVEMGKKRFEGALFLTSDIPNIRTRQGAIEKISDAQAEAGLGHDAMRTVELIPETPGQVAKSPANVNKQRQLGYIAHTLIRNGELEQAMQVTEKLLSPWEKSYALNRIAAAKLEAGEEKDAKELLQRAFNTAQEIENPLHRNGVLLEIVGRMQQL